MGRMPSVSTDSCPWANAHLTRRGHHLPVRGAASRIKSSGSQGLEQPHVARWTGGSASRGLWCDRAGLGVLSGPLGLGQLCRTPGGEAIQAGPPTPSRGFCCPLTQASGGAAGILICNSSPDFSRGCSSQLPHSPPSLLSVLPAYAFLVQPLCHPCTPSQSGIFLWLRLENILVKYFSTWDFLRTPSKHKVPRGCMAGAGYGLSIFFPTWGAVTWGCY